jgi:hypothetical protein
MKTKQNNLHHSFRQIPQLGPFIQSICRLDPKRDEYNQLVIVEERSYTTETGFVGKINPVLLWYKDIDNFSIVTFRNFLRRFFDFHKLRYSDDLANSFLLLCSYFQNIPDAILILEEIFLSIQTVSLFQYYLLPG